MRSRILVIPAVSDLSSFGRLVSHLGHYFGHVDPERIVVFVDASLRREAEAWLGSPSLPPAFSDRVLSRIVALRSRIELHPWPEDLEALALTSDLALDWDVSATDTEPWASVKSRFRLDRTLFSIDWQGIRLGAAWLAEAASVVVQGRAFDRSQAQAFAQLRERVGRAPRAYLVGSGPSARSALDRDLSDGIRIVCNTVVLDDELMRHVQPQILTFADPIFHFGPSRYVQRFQEAVVEQAAKHEFSIVTTERFAPLLRAHLPEIADRVIGLRQGNARWPDNFDLLTHPAVRPYPSDLTMLMLPLGATLADSIGLIGFDGRAPHDDDSRSHGSTVQLEEELKDLRLVHPGFFELADADSYDDHIATVERLFVELEERGIEVRPLAESFIPALRRRLSPAFAASPTWTSDSRPMLVSLTPDWISDFGHFGPFERRVHEEAEASGHMHVALASAGLQPTGDWQVPVFSEATFSSTGRFAPVGMRFENELRTALDQLRLRPGAVVFLYTADVWQLVAILAVAAAHPEARFVVNLMRSHGWLDRALHGPDQWIEGLVGLLGSCLTAAARMNVDVAVDTEALARDVELLTGQPVLVWPMIAVSSLSGRPPGSHAPDGQRHVVAPIQAQGGKGFPELVALAERVKDRLERGELRLTARWPVGGTSPEMVRMAERFEENGGRLVRHNLTDEAFVELVESADVALIPYRVRPFRTRTSAVTIDALLAGKPVVAVRGTWAGDLVEQYGAGLTYTDGDVAEMDDALSRVIGQLDDYRRRVAEIRDVVEADHAPARLIEFLASARSYPKGDEQTQAHIEDVRERADRMRRLFQWHAAAEAANRMAAVIREDDQQRTIDTWRDQADGLKRAIGHRDLVRAAADATRAAADATRAADAARAAAVAAERMKERSATVNSKPRPPMSRMAAIGRALTSGLGVLFVMTGLLITLAGGLAVTGSVVPALLAVAVAIVTSALALLVIAVRLERRTGTARPGRRRGRGLRSRMSAVQDADEPAAGLSGNRPANLATLTLPNEGRPRVIDQATIDAHKWFHAIDFGDVSSAGRIPPNRPPNYTLFGIYSFLEAIDVTGLDVIDLGTMDGLMAFMLKRLGAGRVVATDLWDRQQFRLAREILAYENEVEYHTSLDIRDMDERFGDRAFDLMVLGGVLYHLLSPLESLIACRRLLRRDGLLLLETCFDESSQDMHITYNMGMEPAPFNEPTTYFLPTLPALLALLRTASFDPIGVARLQHGSARVSVLARAVRPSAVRNKTEVQRLHDTYVDSPTHFAFGATFFNLEHDDQEGSRATYTGPDSFETEIDVTTYAPSVPLQPTWGGGRA